MDALSKMEVRVLLKLKGEETISELASELGLSIYRTSVLVASIKRKGLTKTEKRGRYKIVSLSEAKPAEIFKRLTSKFGHMPLDEILSGRNLALLAVLMDIPLSTHELCIKGNLPRSTFYHVINRGNAGEDIFKSVKLDFRGLCAYNVIRCTTNEQRV